MHRPAIKLHRAAQIKRTLDKASIFRLYWFGDRNLVTQKCGVLSFLKENSW
ncbi:hypothetical protein NIES2100_01160 [Calothrix sp. NIES-2100]|nr:hypothetical protein NIES2100_01160 [Calothrix sp. NIES-2100]